MRIATAMAATLLAAVTACSAAGPTDTTTTAGNGRFVGMAVPPGPRGGPTPPPRPTPPTGAPSVRPTPPAPPTASPPTRPTPPAPPTASPSALQPLPAHSPSAPAPATVTEASLGRALFFDRSLSKDGSVSCASCHDPAKGWSDGRPTSVGVGGATGNRNAPTIRNASRQPFQFWDGRAATLEAQALGPVQAAAEMNLTLAELETRLQGNPTYAAQFRSLYGSAPTSALFARAVASFERTETVTDDFAQRVLRGDPATLAQLSPQARAGQNLFRNLNCVACHGGPDARDDRFHNLGVDAAKASPDPGRFAITNNPADRGGFKTPTLTNVGDSAPYMHDGSLATLRDVVEFYNRGGNPNPNLDRRMRPLNLNETQKQELVAFLSVLKAQPVQP